VARVLRSSIEIKKAPRDTPTREELFDVAREEPLGDLLFRIWGGTQGRLGMKGGSKKRPLIESEKIAEEITLIYRT